MKVTEDDIIYIYGNVTISDPVGVQERYIEVLARLSDVDMDAIKRIMSVSLDLAAQMAKVNKTIGRLTGNDDLFK